MLRRRSKANRESQIGPEPLKVAANEGPIIEIPDEDPLHPFLLHAGVPVDLTTLQLSSPALNRLREAGVSLVVPLISQGELLGTLNLGPRLSDQPYSSDDRKLLANLASQVAPAVKVAQLVRQQEEEAKDRERMEQELRVAALIQQTLLPRHLPTMEGWEIDAYYRPARAVGGDFYDFHNLSDGRLGLVIGDVTDKGVPAALVMATCRSMLRSAAQQHDDPGQVLAAVNEALVDEIPPAMFVTCFYGMLEPASGEFVFANAGHNVPYVRTADGVTELRATGMPLGLMPGMRYEMKTTRLAAGDTTLFTSDGIAEAHDSHGEMFGLSRIMGLVGGHGGRDLTGAILEELDRWSRGAEQEDDVTMVTLRRTASAEESAAAFKEITEIASFQVPSQEGNERSAMVLVADVVRGLGLNPERLERLKTAVAEATMNAIEHGNQLNPELPVLVTVLASNDRVVVRVRDQGGGKEIAPVETPDLEAKLSGAQTPRGWGLFLIENMVDRLSTNSDDSHHTIELEMRLKEPVDAGE